MKVPDSPIIPIVVIAAGTGIAPFKSFLDERGEEGLKSESEEMN
jgi:sulfite reductase (NADPH) flavoprotein alpha-component